MDRQPAPRPAPAHGNPEAGRPKRAPLQAGAGLVAEEELAFASGIHQTYLSGVETGARNPTITVLKKLADALGVRPAALLE